MTPEWATAWATVILAGVGTNTVQLDEVELPHLARRGALRGLPDGVVGVGVLHDLFACDRGRLASLRALDDIPVHSVPARTAFRRQETSVRSRGLCWRQRKSEILPASGSQVA